MDGGGSSAHQQCSDSPNRLWGKGKGHPLKRLRGPPPEDSHNKLIAWLAEMAESDNLPLDTSVFVKHITDACDKAKSSSSNSNSRAHHHTNNSNSSNHSLHKMMSSGSTDRAGASSRCSLFSGKGGRRHVALLHNSASYESRTTSGSHIHRHGGGTTGRAGYSRSLDDAIVSRHTAWRQQHQLGSRQGTCSDDLEEDSELRNASMESLYSSSDRDSDVEAMANTYWEHASSRRGRLSRQREHRELRRPLLRQALLGSSTCSGGLGADADHHHHHPGYGSCCSSHRNSLAALGSSILPDYFLPCTASMGDLDKLETDPPGSDGDSNSETAARQIPAAKRRSISMLNLTPPGRAAYYVPDSALPDAASPIQPPSSEMFLDDTLLDGNLADILFSVEALWPKK